MPLDGRTITAKVFDRLVEAIHADMGGSTTGPKNLKRIWRGKGLVARFRCGVPAIIGRCEFSGVRLDEVVHADRLLACEFEQAIGHTVVAALLVQLRHHGEVLDDVRRHARPQKLFAPAKSGTSR